MPTREKDTYCVHSVENALALLEVLGEEDGEVTLTRLSERLGVRRASVFRLLATFENRGYVQRRQGSTKYSLGPSAHEIGQKLLSRMELLRKARPVMQVLAREHDEAVYLVFRRQEEALFLDMVDSAQQVKVVPLVGRRFPLGEVAAGRVLGAYADDDNGTIEEREAIRRQGYCLSFNDVGEGVVSVATPLFNGAGKVVAALVLLGPDFRLPPERVEGQLLPALRLAGEVVSSKLGYFKGYARVPEPEREESPEVSGK